MQIGLFFTHPLPRPWHDGSEHELFQRGLEQIELADRIGIDAAWLVEQHFLEEYSHSSAPEILLAAASQRTTRIRLGHGVMLMPPAYNQAVRIAERVATLDLVSNGRVELGFGNSKSRMELEGFGIDPAERHAMTLEAVGQVTDMMVMDPYPGFASRYITVPARNVLPKPMQRPHPPLWVACSDDATMHRAAQQGVGALVHTFFDGDEARRIIDDYYDTFKAECVPVGHAVNPNVAMVLPFFCHTDADEALRIGREAHGFTTYAARHYYSFGRHRPGRTRVAEDAAAVRDEFGGDIPLRGAHGIGNPEQIAAQLRVFRDAGVDQVVLMHWAGGMSQRQTCDSLKLFAREVLPEFADAEPRRRAEKDARLAPFVAAAMARKQPTASLADADIPVVDAYGLSRPDVEMAMLDGLPDETRSLLMELQRMKQIVLRRSR